MRTVWKFPLLPTGNTVVVDVPMPEGADILCVQEVEGEVFAWASVDTDAKATVRKLAVVPTGAPMPSAAKQLLYVDTFQFYTDTPTGVVLVFHVFEVLL